MVKISKIKGKRLDPNAQAKEFQKVANNVNTLEIKVNKIIDALRAKGIIS